jgi:hypothetical protein
VKKERFRQCTLGLGFVFCFEIGEGRVLGHMLQVWGLVKRTLVVVGVVGVVIVVVTRGGGLHDEK